MPRIDPLSLLKCLSVLLGSTGGIKSKEEVHRLANLMTKFSKKLVSKCIYIQILKTTDTELLSQFMGSGGWNLVHMWLTDGILAKNWALIQELLELLLLCPVDIERLKSNNCPKLVKGLSKEGSHQGVRILATRLVEQWLKIVKGEAAPNSVPAQIVTLSSPTKPSIPTAIVHSRSLIADSTTLVTSSTSINSSNNNNNNNNNNNSSSNSSSSSSSSIAEKNETDAQVTQSNCCLDVDEKQTEISNDSHHHPHHHHHHHRISEKTADVENKLIQPQTQTTQQKKKSFVVVPSSQAFYKITIRDGKQVLTKLETDSTNITNAINVAGSEINGDVVNDAHEFQNVRDAKFDDTISQKVSNQTEELSALELPNNQVVSDMATLVVSTNDNCETDNEDNKNVKQLVINSENKKSANDKENRDFSKKDDDNKMFSNNNSSNSNNSGGGGGSSSSSSSTVGSTAIIHGDKTTSSEKKNKHHSSSSSSSKSSSKHSSSQSRSSNSHRSSSSSSSSHRSNSKSTTSKDKTKDKHHSTSGGGGGGGGSSSSNSSSSASSGKHGSNSKSRSERDKEKERERERQKKDQAEKDKATLEKVQGPALTLKLGKIPKKKTDDDANAKKSCIDSKDKESKKTLPGSTEKKNISISIENRKIQDSTRPKTVKTFNSKFRSTGLEEEVKPPPPRSARKSNIVADKPKILSLKSSSLKRPSPSRESSSSDNKKARLLLDNSITPPNDEKKGGIKLIPPKPKRETFGSRLRNSDGP